ncbi:hypothetical protein E2C01_046732 [Portunus trituberculatus]|uniref:Uncharacterized protein n=1 Tax=Portunus trituberculatus TaxID=210409 RepID=A0A5B7G6G8_PORTR|nr:hypothetical protein [Portunus trituberculatus]
MSQSRRNNTVSLVYVFVKKAAAGERTKGKLRAVSRTQRRGKTGEKREKQRETHDVAVIGIAKGEKKTVCNRRKNIMKRSRERTTEHEQHGEKRTKMK